MKSRETAKREKRVMNNLERERWNKGEYGKR